MSLNSNFKDLLSALNRCEAKYMVVGGYAVMLYTEPRYTKDLDISGVLKLDAGSNAARCVFRALAEFGAISLWPELASRGELLHSRTSSTRLRNASLRELTFYDVNHGSGVRVGLAEFG